MSRVVRLALGIVVALSLLPGCGKIATSGASSSPPLEPVTLDSSLVLSEEPAGAKSVAEVRKNGKDGEEVVVAGWIGGSETPIIQGRAAFTMVDLRLPPPECTTKPYSYCCMPKEALLPNLIMVKFVDGDGNTILKDARELLGIKEGCIVVVRGHLECSEDGTVTSIVGNALFNRGYSENPTKLAVFQVGLPSSK